VVQVSEVFEDPPVSTDEERTVSADVSAGAGLDMPFSGVEIIEDDWSYPGTEGMSPVEQAEQAAADAAAVTAEAASSSAPVSAGAVAPPAAAPPAPAPGPAGPQSAYPKFEGHEVTAVEINITGAARVESLAGLLVSIDDRVRLVGDYRVSGVHHKTNKDGELVRVMTLKVSELQLAPWDPSDPTDDGVVRSRPAP
jgi:hypothetical protein